MTKNIFVITHDDQRLIVSHYSWLSTIINQQQPFYSKGTPSCQRHHPGGNCPSPSWPSPPTGTKPLGRCHSFLIFYGIRYPDGSVSMYIYICIITHTLCIYIYTYVYFHIYNHSGPNCNRAIPHVIFWKVPKTFDDQRCCLSCGLEVWALWC